MRKNTSSHTAGFGILELLVVIAIIGVLAVIAIPKFFQARNVAQDRSAESFASSVYKVAFAHSSENLTSGVIADPDCTDGYVAGGYDAGPPSGVVTSCAVTASVEGTPIVTVVSINGKTTVLTN